MDTDCLAFVHCIEEIVWDTTENGSVAAPGASGTDRMLRLGNGGEALNEKCSGRASAF